MKYKPFNVSTNFSEEIFALKFSNLSVQNDSH